MKATEQLHSRLGLAVAGHAYQAYRQLLTTPRWLQLDAEALLRPGRT
jgi:hypothetical protein